VKNRNHPAMSRVMLVPRDAAGGGWSVMNRERKISFGVMRAAGVHNVLIYCSNHRCGYLNIVADDADRWPDDLRLSDIEDRFVCTACGQRGADIRPDWQNAKRSFGQRQT
jgi:hypothetical protein